MERAIDLSNETTVFQLMQLGVPFPEEFFDCESTGVNEQGHSPTVAANYVSQQARVERDFVSRLANQHPTTFSEADSILGFARGEVCPLLNQHKSVEVVRLYPKIFTQAAAKSL